MTFSRRSAIALFAALAVSVCANLFFVGFHFAPWHRGGPPDRMDRLAGIAGIGEAPPEVRDLLRGEFEAERPRIREAFRDVREARRVAREAMRADPFDAAALDSAYADLRVKSDALLAVIHETVGQGLAKAPAEARSEIRSWRGGE